MNARALPRSHDLFWIALLILGTLVGCRADTPDPQSVGEARLALGSTGSSTFAGDAQHTAVFTPAAQDLNAVHWSTTIDLNNSGAFAHYGAPLISAANTVLVPVKTATNGFQVNAFNGATGAALYSLATDYILPSYGWIPSYQPVLATATNRFYYAGAGGTVYYVGNPDSAGHDAPVQQVFYTTLTNYQANAAAFNSTVFIDTPLTADAAGNVFFGFRVQGTAPAPLSTTQSGFARIDPNGNAVYVLAGTAAGDAQISRDSHNSAPAISNDGTTVYVPVKSASTEYYGYLLGLDSTTLATKYKVFLKDPRNTNGAGILDDGTASPTVAPDNDVYFGVMGNPFDGSRGFLLRFSADLSVTKAPGGFGWDFTAGIVPASMVPSYAGPSSYLILSKYNNYANAGSDSGDGVNRIALLDPNVTEVDAHTSSHGMAIMREVMTVIGPTPDTENQGTTYPNAVREWCINSPAINPATNSVFTPSEDGHIYRWNLAQGALTQVIQLGAGVGEPYVSTVIGPDGTVFTLNGGSLFAIGGPTGESIRLSSSTPDVTSVVTGQSLTFTAAVASTGSGTPTGIVTFTDTIYFVNAGTLESTVTTLASNVPLDGAGHASVTTAALTAGAHFIDAAYSGDGSFAAGSANLVQRVHAGASTTALSASPNPSGAGQSVTFTATVAAVPPATGTPTGMVTFTEGSNVLAQVPVNGSGVATFSTSALAMGSHTLTASYASDTAFASSAGSTTLSVITATTTTLASSPNPSVFGQSVTFTATVTSSGGVPAGTVTFSKGSTVLASNVPVDGAGHASFSTGALAVGSNTITAAFTGASGWANSSGSDSSSPQVVNKASTSSTVTSSLNPSRKNQSVTFTAAVVAVAPGAGTPSGSVTFKDGNATLGTQTLDGTGHASLSTSSLNKGTHSITVVYAASTSFNGSTSPVLSQVVQ